MNTKNITAFICVLTGSGLSLFQTVVSIPDLYVDLSFLDFMLTPYKKELFIASCMVLTIAVLAAIFGLCALFRKGKGFYILGLAGCSATYISAICIYTSNIQTTEAIKMTFQSWHKTYLVWALLFLIAAVLAFRDYKAFLLQQDNDNNDEGTTPSPETLLQTNEHTSTQIHTDTDTLTAQAHTFLSQGNFHEAERCYREALKHNHENSAAYLGQLMAQLNVRNIDQLRAAHVHLAENTLFRLAMLFADDDQRIALRKCLDP